MLVKTEGKAPTCIKNGNIEYWTCSECGLRWKDSNMTIELADGDEVLKASGHHYPATPAQTDWKTNGTSHWLICDRENCPDQTGSISQKAAHTFSGDTCSVCGYARAHVHDLTYVAAQDATCTTDGNLAYYKCSGCDSLFEDKTALKATSADEIRIPALEHSWSLEHDAEGHWEVCTVCQTASEKAAHSFAENTCIVCGYQKPEDTTKPEDTAKPEDTTKPDDNQTNTNTVTRSDSRDHDDDKGNSTSGSWVMNEKGWYFKQNNGSYPRESWMKLNWLGAESWYYFDNNGYMKTGWLDKNGERYYLNPIIGTNSGRMLTGWQLIDGKWYYFSTEAGAGEGRLLRSTTTPDHYQVDQNGVWQP